MCVLTLKNIRQQVQRINPALANGNHSLRRIDRQMIRMLIGQILTQLACILPFAILNLIGLFINSSTVIYNFFFQILCLPLFVSYATSFYVFTLSSRIYQQELKKILCCSDSRQDMSEGTMVITKTAAHQH